MGIWNGGGGVKGLGKSPDEFKLKRGQMMRLCSCGWGGGMGSRGP